MPFWEMDPYPSLDSVQATYNGVGCLAPYTRHDDRTSELIYLNLAQAILFRIASMIYGWSVAQKFGGGLKSIFYRDGTGAASAAALASAQAEAEKEHQQKQPEGGVAVKFVSKKKKNVVASTGTTASSFEMSAAGAGASLNGEDDAAPRAPYQQFADGNNNDNNGSDDDGNHDHQAPLEDDGITEQEMRDELAW